MEVLPVPSPGVGRHLIDSGDLNRIIVHVKGPDSGKVDDAAGVVLATFLPRVGDTYITHSGMEGVVHKVQFRNTLVSDGLYVLLAHIVVHVKV